MGKPNTRMIAMLLIICMFLAFVSTTFADDHYAQKETFHEEEEEEEEEEENKVPTPTISERVRSAFSLSTSSPISISKIKSRSRSYWDKFLTLVNQAQAYYFPPNLDFRGSDETEASGENVKEAVEKSLEKSRETVEESAKSAAEIAAQTIHKTNDKVKKTLSSEL